MLANWILQTVTSGGTGDIVLGSNYQGYLQISTQFNNNDAFFYTIEDGFNKEVGVGQYISASNSVRRTQVIETLNAGYYNNNTPSPLNVSPSAKLFVSGGVQSLTTHMKIWKERLADLFIPPSTSVLVPDYKPFVVNVNAFHFSPDLSEELGLRLGVDHDISVGSTLFPNVCWSPTDSTQGTVRWGITLASAEVDGTFADAGVIYLEQAGVGVTNTHQRIEFSASAIVAPTPNAIIIGKVFRDSSHVNDTYTGNAVLHSVSLNYQADKLGTPNKNLNLNDWI